MAVHQFLPFIVIGLATGAVYGLAGLGLVLTYKTSGIFNFAYGSIAALVAFLFYLLHADHHIPWALAAAICVFIFAPILGFALELLARSLDGSAEAMKVVATVGLILIVEAIGSFWHPTNPPLFPHFLPQSTIRVLSVNITWEQIILFVFSAAASGVLYWFFRSVRLGIVMRGLVDSHELVSMCGDSPVRVRRWAWIIGTGFAGIAGLLLAPDQQLDGVSITTLVFAAFGAAAIGYFSNLPLTFVGGLLIGIAGSLVDKYSATISWAGGIPPSLPFIILFVVLIVTPKRRLIVRRLVPNVRVRRPYQAPTRIRVSAAVIVVGLLALVPSIQSGHLALWSAALVDVMVFLSLGLLVRRSGQISLCHMAFAAVGAAAFSHLTVDAGLPWLVGVLLAGLVAVPVGALIAVPAVRVSGVFLALATLGFGLLAQEVFYSRSFMFGALSTGVSEPRPNVSIGGWNMATDKGYYYVLLLFAVLVALAVTAITTGRLGRMLGAMGDSTLALETRGASSTVLKVIIFCISAAIASIAGALSGGLFHFAVGDNFQPFDSLTLVVLLLIITVGDPWYAVVGAVGHTVISGYIHGTTVSSVLLLFFGVSGASAVYGTRLGGTPAPVRALLDRLGGRRPEAEPIGEGGERIAPVRLQTSRSEAPPRLEPGVGLAIQDLAVSFGGVRAVKGVSLTAEIGMITGLVGPNGAGKTTIFNACSGLVRPTEGRVFYRDIDITAESPPQRARRGVGRTFQRPELFNSLTVRQNVAMAREAKLAGSSPISQVLSSRAAMRDIATAADDALQLTGIARLGELQVGLLPIGQRRLVELASVLAGSFDLLLLDEPSSGLDGNETEAFGRVLRTVVAERGTGIFLVEHDMSLVRGVCDHVYVIDFGVLIFEGTAVAMQNSDAVRAAYLGETAASEAAGTSADSPLAAVLSSK